MRERRCYARELKESAVELAHNGGRTAKAVAEELGINLENLRRWLSESHEGEGGTLRMSDITYLRTKGGWLYLTTVIELWDRKVIGWSMAEELTAGACVPRLGNGGWQPRCPGKAHLPF